MFAILNTKTNKLATLSFSSNGDAEFCSDTTCTIDFNDSAFFIAETREEAEKVLTYNENWYISSANSPKWGYEFEKALASLKVVELQIKG